jgi:hypothetical protein
VKGHQAVIGNDIPTKDSVIEFRFRLGGAQSVTAEFDDRKFNGSHYGDMGLMQNSTTCLATPWTFAVPMLQVQSVPKHDPVQVSQAQ